MEYLSVDKIRELDAWAINELGISQTVLMENAGRGVAEYIIEEYSKYKNIVIVCGKGNNGGDGLVVERLLKAKDFQVRTMQLPRAHVLPPAELYVDAIFGTGFKGEISGVYKEVIKAMNNSNRPIISVDIPSGINGDFGPSSEIYIKPAATVTFVAKKLFMREKPELFGQVKVIDIGIPLTHP